MVEEAVEAIQTLFAGERASFRGQYYRFEDVELAPKPPQARLPILYGSNNFAQVRRAARNGTGWLPAALPVERIAHDVGALHRLAAEAGRDLAEIEVAPQYMVQVDPDPAKARRHFETSQMYKHVVSLSHSTLREQAALSPVDINLVGSPDQVVEKCLTLKVAGVTYLCGLYFAAADIEELLDQMSIFAEIVIPRLGD